MRINCDLRVVGLHEGFLPIVSHHPRIGIDEVILPAGSSGILFRSAALLFFLLALLAIFCWLIGSLGIWGGPRFAVREGLEGSIELVLRFLLQFHLGLPQALQAFLRTR